MYDKFLEDLNLGEFLSQELIQTLWSSYGELVRLNFSKKSIIIKHVKLPKEFNHPKGWNSKISHERKINSYKVEVSWYENFSKQIDCRCETARVIKTFSTNSEFLIIMEDLKEKGFTKVLKEANKTQIESSLKWLANFHAKYMNTKTKLLWEEGTYWHLATREEEFKALEDKKLKDNAKKIDELLKNSKYQTLVHGDAKLANFCFNEEGTKCAAVDFQYVGHGCAMKDVILFMSSVYDEKACEAKEKWFLETYFNALKEALLFYKKDIKFEELKKEYEYMYFLAWADFLRFLKGWSPKHFKINSYSESTTLKAYEYLK